jgi:hypothetical protein
LANSQLLGGRLERQQVRPGPGRAARIEGIETHIDASQTIRSAKPSVFRGSPSPHNKIAFAAIERYAREQVQWQRAVIFGRTDIIALDDHHGLITQRDSAYLKFSQQHGSRVPAGRATGQRIRSVKNGLPAENGFGQNPDKTRALLRAIERGGLKKQTAQ